MYKCQENTEVSMFKCTIVQALTSLIKDCCEHTCLRGYNECSRLEKTDYGARIDFHQYSSVTTLIVMWLKTRVSWGCYTKTTESICRVGSLPRQQVSSHFPCCWLCFPCHQCSSLTKGENIRRGVRVRMTSYWSLCQFQCCLTLSKYLRNAPGHRIKNKFRSNARPFPFLVSLASRYPSLGTPVFQARHYFSLSINKLT